jgi:tRNA pseudouridine38-40 synthase
MAPGASSAAPVVARYLLRVAYDGKNFHGFQRQAKARTVQGCVEAALARILGAPPARSGPADPAVPIARTTGSSRTDAGVHALDATAHVDIARERRRTSEPTDPPPPPHLARSVKSALNHFLKRQGCEDVRVEACVRVCPRTFHARFCATARTYRYRVRVAEAPPPVHEIGRVWHLATERVAGGGRARRGKVPEKHRTEGLGPEKHRTERTERTETNRKSVLRVRDVVTRMRLASEALAGADVDFSSFRAAGCQAKSPVRTLTEVRVEAVRGEWSAYEPGFRPEGFSSVPGERAGPGVPAEDDLSLVAVAEDDPNSFSSRGQKRDDEARASNDEDSDDDEGAIGSAGGGFSEVVLTFRAPSFLYHQVRLMTATLVAAGLGEIDKADVEAILRAKDPGAAFPMAPAHGLYLARVHYDGTRTWNAGSGGGEASGSGGEESDPDAGGE